MTTGIIELVFASLVVAGLYASRNLWGGYFEIKSKELEISNADKEVELQPKIKAVMDKQEACKKTNGKWLTLDDLKQI